MKIRRVLPLLLIVILAPTILVVPIIQAEGGQYRDYYTFMAAFRNLADAYPHLVTYQTVGRTVQGRVIVLFMIGNPAGGRVLFDGAMHGEENLGSEVLYSYAKWLLTSNDPLATQILTGTYTLLIPALNVDNYRNLRWNAHHVDLNRNFETNWERARSSDPTSEFYRGSGPLSEPESQTLINMFQTYNPYFYVNLHRGDACFYVSSYGNATFYSLLFDKMDSLSRERGVPSYPHYFLRGSGFAISDASQAGVTSFLLELIDWETVVSFSEIESVLLPKFIPVAAVLSQECSSFSPFPSWDVDQNGIIDIIDAVICSSAFGSHPGDSNWNPKADFNEDDAVDILDLQMVATHFGEGYI